MYHGFESGALLAAQVVRERRVELGRELGLGARQLVVNRQRVGDQARAAARARVEAEETDEIGAVGVEREPDAADLVAA